MHSPSSDIRLRDDGGHGAPLVFLQPLGAPPSPTAALLAREFRVLNFEAGAVPNLVEGLSQAIARATADPLGIIATSATAHQALALALARPAAVNALALLAPPPLDQSGDLAGRLSGLNIAVLALFGTRDATSPSSLGKQYRQAIPGCHLTFVYDTGPDMDRERPEAVAAALGDFMRTRERYLVTTRSSRLYP